MSTTPLPVSRLIGVSVALTPAAVQALNQSGMMIVGSSNVIDVKTRYRTYFSLAAVGADFGNSAPEYLGAQAWFAQSPQPLAVTLGRWAQAATKGQLFGAPFSAAQAASLLTALQAITTGSFTISIDGTPHNITALDFHLITNLNGAATIIQTDLPAGATCVWNAVYGYFEITGIAAGTSGAVTFAIPEGTGVDVSSTLGLAASSSGAYVVAGIAAESALAAVQALDLIAGTTWYGLFVAGAVDADHEVIAPYIQAASNYHFYGVNTQEAGVLNPSGTTDIAYILSQAGYTRTAVQYSSSSLYAVISMMARIMTTDYTANNSVITLMYKQEPIVSPEFLNANQINALEAKNANVFVAYNNNSAIIEPGITCAGIPWYIDVLMGLDDLVSTMQAALYNVLFGTTTKIPQTDSGMHVLATTIEDVCVQFVNDGLLGPGTWTGPTFGSLNEGDFMPKGFYVYAPPVATQSVSSRAKRVSVPFQVAVKLAGAVQTVSVAITVND